MKMRRKNLTSQSVVFKGIKKLITLVLLAALLGGCATIFLPRKQNVTINVNIDSVTVFNDGIEFGSNGLYKERIKRNGTRQVVLTSPGYWNQSEVLPANYRPGGFWFCQLLNAPMLIGIIVDVDVDKNFSYKKVHHFSMEKSLIPTRQEVDEKYLEPDKFYFSIDDPELNFISLRVRYHSDSLVFSERKAEVRKDREKFVLQERKKRESGKKFRINFERGVHLEQKDLQGQANATLRFRLLDVMVESGFLDTMPNILQDPNNTLFLNAEIKEVVFCEAKNGRNYSMFTHATVDMIWHITDNYGEWIKSIPIKVTSGNFKFVGLGEESYESSFFDALNYSYLQLLRHPDLQQIIPVEKDYSSKDEKLVLELPVDSVISLADAGEATVTVKTSDGTGTGFAITNDGYILTNYHVITGSEGGFGKDLVVIDKDGNSHIARLIRVNKFRDIALLKVHTPFKKAFKVSNDSAFELLEMIHSLGAPRILETEQEMREGILSGVRKSGMLHLLQLNMNVETWHDGGPVFDDDGKLLGILQSKLVGQFTEGIAFAIPGHRVFEYLNLSY